jgi:hypothetical protein
MLTPGVDDVGDIIYIYTHIDDLGFIYGSFTMFLSIDGGLQKHEDLVDK